VESSQIPPILTYHLVDPNFYWGITRITPRQFEYKMSYLSETGYDCVTVQEALTSHSPKTKQVCITFDDSYESVYKYAFPILERFNIRATVFVITGYIGKSNAWDVIIGNNHRKHMNWEQLRTLSKSNWEIASHTTSHIALTTLSKTSVDCEVNQSKHTLERRLNTSISTFSYPFGHFNQRIMCAVKKANYKFACGMVVSESMKNASFFPYNLERRPIYFIDTLKTFKQKLLPKQSSLQVMRERILTYGCKGTILVKSW